jgi:uncharacterized protein
MRPEVVDLVRERLEKDPRIRFALVFGSVARSRAHARSDLDLAIAAVPPLRALELGGLVADLEQIAGCPVDVVELDRAPAALAFRVFRDGTVLIDRDHQALLARKARAILDYLDWRPIEQRLLDGVRRRIGHGRP